MSRFRLPYAGISSSTQVVYNPASYVAAVKETLAEKSGLPADQRRLIFTPCAQPSSEAVATADEEHSAEDVLSELHGWQAILFQDGRALGRLVSPQLRVTSLSTQPALPAPAAATASDPDTRPADSGAGAGEAAGGQPEGGSSSSDGTETAAAAGAAAGGDDCSSGYHIDTLLEVHQLVFDRWQPVWTDFRSSSRTVVLHIPVNGTWRTANYRLQVIGKARGAGSFLLPGSYEISGQRSTAAISLHQQRCSYVRAHQRRRAGLLGGNADASPVAEQDADLHFECGSELNGLTAVFNVADSPAWLKAVVLKFALVARMVRDGSGEAAQPSGQPAASVAAAQLSDQPAASAAAVQPAPPAQWQSAARAEAAPLAALDSAAAAAAAEELAAGAAQAPQHRKRVKRNHRQRRATRELLASLPVPQAELDTQAEAAAPEASPQAAGGIGTSQAVAAVSQPPVATCAASGHNGGGRQRTHGGAAGGGGGGGGDSDDPASDGEGGADGSRAGSNGSGGGGAGGNDGDGGGRRNLRPYWDGRGKRPPRKRNPEEAEDASGDDDDAGSGAVKAGGSGGAASSSGGAANSSASSSRSSSTGNQALISESGSEARAAAIRALAGTRQAVAASPRKPAQPPPRMSSQSAPHLARQQPLSPHRQQPASPQRRQQQQQQQQLANGHAGAQGQAPEQRPSQQPPPQQPPSLPPPSQQQQKLPVSKSMPEPAAAAAAAAAAGTPAQRQASPQAPAADDSGGHCLEQPEAAAGSDVQQQARPAPGPPARMRPQRPAPAIYIPPQLRGGSAVGAALPVSQLLLAPPESRLDPLAAAASPSAGSAVTGNGTGIAHGGSGAERPSPAATLPSLGAAPALPVAGPPTTGNSMLPPQQQQPQQQRQQQEPSQRRQQLPRAGSTAPPDAIPVPDSGGAPRAPIPVSVGTQTTGTPYSSLPEPSGGPASGLRLSEDSSEPSYWSAEEDSPSAASTGSLAAAAAAGGSAADLTAAGALLQRSGGSGFSQASDFPQLGGGDDTGGGVDVGGNGGDNTGGNGGGRYSNGAGAGNGGGAVQRDASTSPGSKGGSPQEPPGNLPRGAAFQRALFPDSSPAPGEERRPPPQQVAPAQQQQRLQRDWQLAPPLAWQQQAPRPAEGRERTGQQRQPDAQLANAMLHEELLPVPPPPPPQLQQQQQPQQPQQQQQWAPQSPVRPPPSSATQSAPQTPVRLPAGSTAPPAANVQPQSPVSLHRWPAQLPQSPAQRRPQQPPDAARQQAGPRGGSPPPEMTAAGPAAGVSDGGAAPTTPLRQVRRPPPLDLPALNGCSLSPDGLHLPPDGHPGFFQRRGLPPPPGADAEPAAAAAVVEAPHVVALAARRELAVVQQAGGATAPQGAAFMPHDRALLAAAAAQASPTLPRAYERSLSFTSLHGMMLPAGLQQQLRLLHAPAPRQPPPPDGAAAVGAASRPLVQKDPLPSSRDARQPPGPPVSAAPVGAAAVEQAAQQARSWEPHQDASAASAASGTPSLTPRPGSAAPAVSLPPPLPPPAMDIERMLASVTPVLTERRGPDAKPLTLADLWAFYLEASVYGQEVFTCGGARGPAHAYFVPLLSGLQLFASVPPGESGEVPDPPPAGGERLFACDGARRSGTRHMRLLAQHSVGENPYSRAPLHAAMSALAERPDTGGRLLFEHPLSELHPASWFAVAWYPVYRIPDAPLTARFLTFHTIAPQQLPLLEAVAGAETAPPEGQPAPPPPPRQLFMPVQGLMWDNLQNEHWFERLPVGSGAAPTPEAPASRLQRHLSDWEVSMMRTNAKLLARSMGLHVQGEHGWRSVSQSDFSHGDFEFFNRRMAVVQ